ncbi:MAG: hypothetical protein Kow00122_21510 [Thermoleophilia bacterium]
MLRECDIICISSLDWHAHWTSKQQIMHRLGAANRILYVEEPVTMLAPVRVPVHWRRWAAVYPRVRGVEPGVWTLRLPPLLPFGNVRRGVNRLNQRVVAAYVRWAAHHLRFRDPLLWTYLPTTADLLDHLRAAAVVYHCVDEHSAFPGFVAPAVVRAYDEALTRRADLVITTAANLRATRLPLNPHTYHVANAADVDHFKRALDPHLPLPADVAAIPRPRIGVIGVHDERLDVAAIEAVARADPAWQVVLVGPVRPGDVDESRLRAMPNVHLLGGKPLAELPGYLKALDVALIPYVLNELSRNIFPLKLFEYLAGGVPVVAAALPELAPYAEIVALAAAPREYPGLVRQALAEDDPGRRAARVALAERNTWDGRVEEISALVEAMLRRTRAHRPAGGAGHGRGGAAARNGKDRSVP